jgi:DNA topoisomerase II
VKKANLLKTLKERGYFPVPKVKAAVVVGAIEEVDDDNDDDVEEDPSVPSAGDYDYLLGMPIWSLTRERVCTNIYESISSLCI